MENFTYADKEMADVFEEGFYNTSFLGVTVNFDPVNGLINGKCASRVSINYATGHKHFLYQAARHSIEIKLIN